MKKKKRIAYVVAIVLFLLALPFAWAAGEDSLLRLYERRIDDPGQEKTLYAKRRADISEYILNCCKDRDAAVRLLRKNGFDLTITSSPDEVALLNEKYEYVKRGWDESYAEYTPENYDEFVSGKRKPSLWRFWTHWNTTYHVQLLIKDGEIRWVIGTIDIATP